MFLIPRVDNENLELGWSWFSLLYLYFKFKIYLCMKSWHKIKYCPPCLHQTAPIFCLWAFVKQILIQLAGAERQWNLAKTFYICLVELDEHPISSEILTELAHYSRIFKICMAKLEPLYAHSWHWKNTITSPVDKFLRSRWFCSV